MGAGPTEQSIHTNNQIPLTAENSGPATGVCKHGLILDSCADCRADIDAFIDREKGGAQ